VASLAADNATRAAAVLRHRRGRLSVSGTLRGQQAGLEMLVKIYAGEMTKTRVRVNLIDPGIVRTRLRVRAFAGEDPTHLPPPGSFADGFFALAVPECARIGEIVIAASVAAGP
jgi:NAD(P)-dependent dehydrogenase (short-subunit alcohol dehydrogenase family)